RQIEREISQWISFIGSVLQILVDMGVKIPSILNDVFGVVDRRTEQTATSVASSTQTMSTSMQAAGSAATDMSDVIESATSQSDILFASAASSVEAYSATAQSSASTVTNSVQENGAAVQNWNEQVIADLKTQEEQWEHWAGSVEES